jgi:hypothetical protein
MGSIGVNKYALARSPKRELIPCLIAKVLSKRTEELISQEREDSLL